MIALPITFASPTPAVAAAPTKLAAGTNASADRSIDGAESVVRGRGGQGVASGGKSHRAPDGAVQPGGAPPGKKESDVAPAPAGLTAMLAHADATYQCTPLIATAVTFPQVMAHQRAALGKTASNGQPSGELALRHGPADAGATDQRAPLIAAALTFPPVMAHQRAAMAVTTSNGQPSGEPTAMPAHADATDQRAPLIAAAPTFPPVMAHQRAAIGETASNAQPNGEPALPDGPADAAMPAAVMPMAVALGLKRPVAGAKGAEASAASAKAEPLAARTLTDDAALVQPKQPPGQALTDEVVTAPDSAARPAGPLRSAHAPTVGEATASAPGGSHGMPKVEPPVARVDLADVTGTYDGTGQAVRTLHVGGVEMTFSGPASQAHVRPGSADRILQQVSASLAASRARGNQEVVVRLSPPELGRIRLQVTSDGRELRAVLEVDNARTFEEIHRQAPALVQRLIDSGLQVKGIDVSLNNSDAGQQHADGSDNMLRDPAHTGEHADGPSGDQRNERRGGEDDQADASAVFVERVSDESIDVMM